MTNSTDGKELADNMSARPQSKVNSEKKTLTLFVAAPQKSHAATVVPEAESAHKPENPKPSAGKEALNQPSIPSKKFQDRRSLKPEFRTKVLNQLTEALGIRQTADLPKIFLSERVYPMKIGIADDLIARYPNAQDRKAVKKALGFLVRSLTYSNAVIEEQRRYDLDLNPVFDETGVITDQCRADALKNIKSIVAKIKKRNKQQN